jgi:glycerol-3-phosphate acyltransferase PlsY
VEALNNVDLSQYFWIEGLGRALPRAPDGAGLLVQILYILYRESPGIVLTLGYFIAVPPLLAVTVFRRFFVRMGLIRYMLMSSLFLFMALLPIKMMLRWTLNLKYIISIPEFFLNL